MLATAYDTALGGRDIDLTIASHFTEAFKQRYKVDAKSKPKPFVRLLQECEKLKKLMSANSTKIPLNIECFMDDKDVTGDMTRDTMEELAAPIFARTEAVFRSILDESSNYNIS